MYEKILSVKGKGSIWDGLEPASEDRINKLKKIVPKIPDDYVQFLRIVGSGTIGDSMYTVCDGILEPEEFGWDDYQELNDIVFFGDDFNGYYGGFSVITGDIVEVGPFGDDIVIIGHSFREFMARFPQYEEILD